MKSCINFEVRLFKYTETNSVINFEYILYLQITSCGHSCDYMLLNLVWSLESGIKVEVRFFFLYLVW